MRIRQKCAIVCAILFVVLCMPLHANATDIDASVEIMGIEQYFTLTNFGLIDFDIEAAEAAGFDDQILLAVQNRISAMNQLVLNENAYITDDFAVVQYTSFGRAVGENKVVTYWYGLTQVYMDSDKADFLYDRLMMYGDNMSNYAYEQALSGAGIEGVGGLLMAGYYYNYSYQVGVAKEAGVGIIMNVQTDLVYGGQSIWFTSQ